MRPPVRKILVFTILLLGPVVRAQSGSKATALPAGTQLQLVLLQGVSSRYSQQGDQFVAGLSDPAPGDSAAALLPKGTKFIGTVSRVTRPGRFRGKAELYLCLDFVRFQDGQQEPIVAKIVRLNSPGKPTINREGTITAGSSAGRDGAMVAGGGLAGAGVGAIGGGKKGAAIGAAVGSVAGLVGVFWSRGDDIMIPAESRIEILLEKPLQLSAAAK